MMLQRLPRWRTMTMTAAIAAAMMMLLLPTAITAVPAGFEDLPIVDIQGATDIAFAGPDLLVTTKRGELWVVPAGSSEAILSIDIAAQTCINGERGLQSSVAHPNFATNRYIYLYYTQMGDTACDESTTTGPWNRVSRFVMNADYTLDASSEFPLFRTPRLEFRFHNGGKMLFGADGYLYVAIGDSGSRAQEVAQFTDRLLGKLVRIADDGSIPPDNPFTMTAGYTSSASCAATGMVPDGSPAGTVCEEMYAYGLRNPFKMRADPNAAANGTVRLFISDVGGRTWEEINEAGTNFPGANYGWPQREGPCDGFGNAGNNIEGCTDTGEYKEPEHWYIHRTAANNGGAIVGGAFVPDGVWPDEYTGSFMFADYVFGEIYKLDSDATLLCRNGPTCADGLPSPGYINTTFHEAVAVVDMEFNVYQNSIGLYYASREDSDQVRIRVIVYGGGSDNAPTAQISASAEVADIGETITFDASNSTDAEGDTLIYMWDFGDGSTTSTSAIAEHAYATKGTYTVTLSVADSNGLRSSAALDVRVGTPPNVTLVSPPENASFAVGDVFTLMASATDSNGVTIDASNITWEVLQHHNTHTHPFLVDVSGNNVTMDPAPEPEDFLASTSSYLEVRVTATDSDGLGATFSRNVMPKKVNITFETIPSGIELVVYDYAITTPQTVVAWEGQLLSVEAPQQSDFVTFDSWSDGGAQNHSFVVPAANDTTAITLLVANYMVGDVLATSAPVVTTPPTAAPAVLVATIEPTVADTVLPTIDPSALLPRPGTTVGTTGASGSVQLLTSFMLTLSAILAFLELLV